MKIEKASISQGLEYLEMNLIPLDLVVSKVEAMVGLLGGALDEGSYSRSMLESGLGLMPGEKMEVSKNLGISAITPMIYPDVDMFVMIKAEGSINDRMISNMGRAILHHSTQMTRGLICNITWTGEVQCCFMWMAGRVIYTFKFS